MEKRLYDAPRSQGEENVLRRARQLYGTAWKPKMAYGINGCPYLAPLRNGKKHEYPECYVGFPYSSTRVLDKFVGLDIRFDTFMTALQNPASIMYTRDLSDFHDEMFHPLIKNTFLVYGAVCSSFVSYSLDLEIHRCTHEWENLEYMDEITDRQTNALQLCDILVTTRADGHTGGHIRIVTGIERNPDGTVKSMEISEGARPFPRCQWYTPQEVQSTFQEGKGNYRIFRYRYLDRVRAPEKFSPINEADPYDLMPDRGDCSNYTVGEPVALHIACAADTVVIEGKALRRSVAVASLQPVRIYGNEYTVATVEGLPAGDYLAYCETNGIPSRAVRFSVARPPEVKLTDASGKPFEWVAFSLVAPDGSPLTVNSDCLKNAQGELSDGVVTVALKDGNRLIPAKAEIQNCDGEWMIRMAAFLRDATGKRVGAFRIGEKIALYAFRAEENAVVYAEFSGEESCTPFCLTWKEEAAIAYDQHILTQEEKASQCVKSRAVRHDNAFAQVVLFSKNAFGTVSSEIITLVLE